MMSVPACTFCKRFYWRFRPDHPPKGYCSVKCREDRKEGRTPDREEKPEVIVWKMRQHRLAVHATTSMLTWFDCETCEELEAKYAASLEWHSARRA